MKPHKVGILFAGIIFALGAYAYTYLFFTDIAPPGAWLWFGSGIFVPYFTGVWGAMAGGCDGQVCLGWRFVPGFLLGSVLLLFVYYGIGFIFGLALCLLRRGGGMARRFLCGDLRRDRNQF